MDEGMERGGAGDGWENARRCLFWAWHNHENLLLSRSGIFSLNTSKQASRRIDMSQQQQQQSSSSSKLSYDYGGTTSDRSIKDETLSRPLPARGELTHNPYKRNR